MATYGKSQNGYAVPLSQAAKDELIHYYPVPGGTVGLKKGDVAYVMTWLIVQLGKVEKPVWPGIWGFNVRPIRGQTSGYSNHASGTAVDWNAPDHGRQVYSRYYGWSEGEQAKVRAILSHLDGVVRWGADYHSLPYDPMHFEIVGTPAQVAAVAAKLKATPKPNIPDSEEKPMFIVSLKSEAAQYLSDGMFRRWIPSEVYKSFLISKGVIKSTTEVDEFDTVSGMTAAAGPVAPGSLVPAPKQ